MSSQGRHKRMEEMGKKYGKFEKKSYVENEIEIPDIYTIDALSSMSDDEIYSLSSKLNTDRNCVLRMNDKTYIWDVELAYIQRELMIRMNRKDAHREYLNTHVETFECDDDHECNVNMN